MKEQDSTNLWTFMTDMFKEMGYISPDLAETEQNNFVKIAETDKDHVRGGNFDDGNI